MKSSNTPEPQKKKKMELTKEERRRVSRNVFLCIITTFLLAVMNMLCDVSAYSSISKFFSKDVFTNIGIIFGIAAFMVAMLFAYISYLKEGCFAKKKIVPLVCVSLLFTYAICIIFGQYINLYIVPITLGALIVGTIVDRRAGVIVNIIMSIMLSVSFMLFIDANNVAECISTLITSFVSGTMMILYIVKSKSRAKFIGVSLIIGVLCGFIPVLVNIFFQEYTVTGLAVTYMWSVLSAVTTLALYSLFLPILESLFKVDTIYKISELCSLNSPLLRRLAKEAPGTFNHSLTVGNLTEQCAVAIGENPTLAKACAYYHDVGKLQNPKYFVENQNGGENIHDSIIPELSVKLITSHTDDGYKILKNYNMPDEICNVAREHHGTTPVKYFYYKAQNITEELLESSEFSYNDPRPTTKIAAIIMIVDTVEAAVRAVGLKSGYQAFIHKLIKEKADLEQFANCPLTFADLQKIEDVLVESIPYISHSRIKYDNKK